MAEEKEPEPYARVVKSNSAIDDGAPPAKVLKHSHDADEAMKAFEDYEGEAMVIDEATNKRLLKQIDFNIMPLLCVI